VRGVQQAAPSGPVNDNARAGRIILLLATVAAAIYLGLALAGDLRAHLAPYLVAHALLVAAMLAAWRLVRSDHRNLTLALAAALLFRLVATAGEPAMSDDLYRYLWDGRVQLDGVHPYAHAPTDESLAGLRDSSWSKINHPELRTIYPPLAQAAFLALAAVNAGPVGVKLAMGLADFGVVLLLAGLLIRAGLPSDRVILYAWNPLAVLETAGSGHVEPLGILLLLLAVGWIMTRRPALSMLALAASVHVKLLPLLLAPGLVRRVGIRAGMLLPLALILLWLPYGLSGPAVGTGLYDYAERWEHNASLYAGIQGLLEQVDTAARLTPLVNDLKDRLGDALPWDTVYRHVWPRELARILVALLLLAWTALVVMRRGADPIRESLLIIGAVMLLSPTVYPWYVLWLLPLAAARLSWGWLAFGATVPLAYVVHGADVPWLVRSVEYAPLVAVAIVGTLRARRRST